MNKCYLPILVLACVTTAATATEASLYRADDTPVLEPVKPAAPKVQTPTESLQQASQAFKSAYDKKGRPRIVVFWNRVLSDDIEQRKEQSVKLKENVRTRNAASSEMTVGEAGAMTIDEARSNAMHEVELVGTTRTVDNGRREAAVDRRQDWMLQSGFLTNLRKAGAKLVDRTMILRNTHLDTAKEKSDKGAEVVDVLRTEGKALRGYADILLEVEMVPDAQSPVGTGFKVTARRIEDGSDVVTYYTQALPPREKLASRYKATANGYAKVQEPARPFTTTQVADQFSAEVLVQLAQGLE